MTAQHLRQAHSAGISRFQSSGNLVSTKASRTIGLIGTFGAGNSGNDGTLEAFVNLARNNFREMDLVCVCGKPDVIQEKFGIGAIDINQIPRNSVLFRLLSRLFLGFPRRIANWNYARCQVKRFDLLVIPGTGALDDFQTGPMGWPYTLFRWCVAARLGGVDIVFLNIGAGPIVHPLSRWFMKKSATMASYRSYRDNISREYMQSIGFDSLDDPVYPDVAFALPTPQYRRTTEAALTVGVGMMGYRGWSANNPDASRIYSEYLSKMTEFISWLLEQGRCVRFLTGDAADNAAIDEVVRRLGVDGTSRNDQLVAEPTTSIHELMDQLAMTDVVVATRYHNVIFALKMRRPVISIGYARKSDVLMADMGLGDFCQYVENFDVNRLKVQFERLVSERGRIEAALEKRCDDYRRQLEQQFTVLTDMLQ